MQTLDLLEPTLNQLFIFAAILTRIGGLVAVAPLLGTNYAPLKIKGFIAVALSLLLTPMFWDYQFVHPGNYLNFILVLGGELFVGLSLGLGVRLLFTGVQITGQLLGQIGGLSVADVFNPAMDSNVPLLAVLFDLVVLAIFLVIGGHRYLITVLLDTFHEIPPGVGGTSPEMTHVLVDILTSSFRLGVQAAAPGTVALLMGVLVMGLISRTLPQLNLIAVGFSFNSMVLLIFIMLTIGSIGWVFQDSVEVTVNSVRDLIINRVTESTAPS
ncbi:MAG: flagellar biosynthetic protein FliR [Pirellulales bacterium]